jgi:2-keto-4-pentenoate hydratase/2-oxohepta-3-ene-1,7-dioic acid hydratase in catechol pathway
VRPLSTPPFTPLGELPSSRPIRIYRRAEGDFIQEGKLILCHGEDCYDLTEYRWHREMPLNLTAICSSGILADSSVERWLEEEDLPRTHAIQPADRLLSPLLPREIGKIIALGKNFREHAEEFGEETPSEPLYFNKLPEGIVGNGAQVSPPRGYIGRLDHEVELAVLICRTAEDVSVEQASDCIGGFTIANDLTLRSLQGADREKRWPWFRSKNFSGSCPLGPAFAPANQLDPSQLRIEARVNGELRQSASLSEMTFSVPEAISHISRHMPLYPGDVLLMGTPAGVGPLAAGDVVTCSIEGLGELTTHIGRS